ncbi:MAG: hypothetical protein FWD31_04665 [Planctomycetaceae bacterium]|nr:hypothetical protein [Planctomycetaceae bacterium]
METSKPTSKLKRVKPQLLRIEKIELLPDIQSRANGLDNEVVNEYAERFESLRGFDNEDEALAIDLYNATGFPRLEVVTPDYDTFWLASGFHRFAALEKVDCKIIPVDVYEGDQIDAQYISMTANTAHGLRRTNADKRKAVKMALEHLWTYQLSNVAIAEIIGVSDKFIAKVRDELIAEEEQWIKEGKIIEKTGVLPVYQNDTPRTVRGDPSKQYTSKRVSKDGKLRKLPPPRRQSESVPDSDADESPRRTSRKKNIAETRDDIYLPDNVIGLKKLITEVHGEEWLIKFFLCLYEFYKDKLDNL